jgi:alpha-L-arabinofuranosidase
MRVPSLGRSGPLLPAVAFIVALAGFGATVATEQQRAAAEAPIALTVDATRSGATIDRNLFGQFAEHLGHGIYEGLWVGPDSPIPNTRGIRNDVVAALKALKVPRCAGPAAASPTSTTGGTASARPSERTGHAQSQLGRRREPNTFGTHEFMDFLDQIGAEAFISVNVGSGTPREAAEWLEYLTAAQETTLAKERAANGRSGALQDRLPGHRQRELGLRRQHVGRVLPEPAEDLQPLRPELQPGAQQGADRMLKIAVGPGGGEPRFVEWTETIMKAWQGRQWSWDMDGLSLHFYSVIRWPPATSPWASGRRSTSRSCRSRSRWTTSSRHTAPSWTSTIPRSGSRSSSTSGARGTRSCPARTEGFLAQQNSVRDAILAALNLNIFARHAERVRMANIAQMVNVLQAMVLTDKAKMVLTPTYHVFRMYVPFQDATFVPVTFDAGRYTHGDITLPRVDAIAAKDASGTLWLALTNVDPTRPADIATTLTGITPRSAAGETLTGPAVDSVNTFEAPDTVTPTPAQVTLQGSRLTLTLAPKSVTVIGVRP